MELFKLLGTIAINNSEAKQALKETSAAAKATGEDIEGTGGSAEKTGGKWGAAFKKIGAGAVAVGKTVAVGLGVAATALGGLTVKALSAAGELEQNMGGSEAVFGKYAEKIQSTAKEAFSQMGLSTSDYLATANKMGALFQGAGFDIEESMTLSQDAMQRAADVASIMGIDTASAMEAVAGAAKGNFTMMDNLGVAMNETTLANYALEKGMKKSYDQMTQQEKIGLAMEMFMDKTAYAAGNYAKENETLAGSLGTAKAALSNFLSGAGTVEDVVSSFSGFADVVVKNINEMFPALMTGITQIVNQLAPKIPELLNKVLPGLIEGATGLINGLVAALPGIVSALMGALPALIQGITQIVNALIAALPSIMQSLVSALPVLLPALIDGLVSMIVTLCTMLPQIIQPIIDYLPAIIISIVNALMQNLPALIDGIIQMVVGIVNALPQIIQGLVDALPTIVSSIVTGLLKCIPQLIMGFIQLFGSLDEAWNKIQTSLKQVIPNIFKGVWAAIKNVFAPLGGWFKDKFSEGAKNAQNAWANAKEKWNEIKNKVTNAFSDLGSKIKSKFNDAKNKAENAWSNAKSKFSSIKDKVVSAFSDVGNKMKTKFSDAKKKSEDAWANTQAAWKKISNKVSEGFSGLGEKLKSKFSSALQKAKDGFSKAKSIGKDLVSGLWNGISDKFNWLTSKIKGFASNVTNKLKSFFGIKSPSRVFRDEIGKQLAAGVAEGITDNANLAEDSAEVLGEKVLAAAEKRLKEYKLYNDMMLADEVAYWDSVRLQLEEGTDARAAADEKYLKAKQDMNNRLVIAEEELQTELDAIQQKVDEKASGIARSFGLFDKAQIGGYVSENDLIRNLDSQVSALTYYQKELNTLSDKIGGTALYEEIESMGIDAYEEIKAINRMSDSQLQSYLDKYNSIADISQQMAEKALEEETVAATQEAYQKFADKCEELGLGVVESIGTTETSITSMFDTISTTVSNTLSSIQTAINSFKPTIAVTYSGTSSETDDVFGNRAVQWHANAMKDPIVMTKPTIFGYDASSGKYHGGGEAGSEVVSGTDTLMNMIQGAVANQNNALVSALERIISVLGAYFPQLLEAMQKDVVLDSGELVGALASPMNNALGKISNRKDRGR